MKIKNKIVEISEMEQAIQTVKEMITQREYKITGEDDDHFIGTNSADEKIIVFTSPVNKFNVDRVKEYISALDELKIKHCIVIYTGCVTPMAKKLVQISEELKIELFTIEELQYNITRHRLVPQHIRLPTEEAKEFKKIHGLKHPTILRTDPIARFYNYQRGDVIKIVRVSDGVKYIAHRIVK